jgi:CheY-like chemotaxis protein
MRNQGTPPVKSILCVCDDRDAAFMLRQVFAGHRIVRAKNAYEAICAAHRQAFDLFVLDSPLPDWTGAALCRVIRTFDPRTPVLISTAAPEQEHGEAIQAGAQGVLAKPLDPAHLQASLRKFLLPGDLQLPAALVAKSRAPRKHVKHDAFLDTLAKVDFKSLDRPGSWWRSAELRSVD